MVQVEEHKRTENLKRAKWRFEQAALLMREAGVSLIAAGELDGLDDMSTAVAEVGLYADQVAALLGVGPLAETPCPCGRSVCRCGTAPQAPTGAAVIDLGVLRSSFANYAENLQRLADSIEPPSGLRAGYAQCAEDVRTILDSAAAGEAVGPRCGECRARPCACQFDVETRAATAEHGEGIKRAPSMCVDGMYHRLNTSWLGRPRLACTGAVADDGKLVGGTCDDWCQEAECYGGNQ